VVVVLVPLALAAAAIAALLIDPVQRRDGMTAS
jgi:hypothetical protein